MSLGADYFDELYARRDDPWRLEQRWYERRKRALTVAMLPTERVGSILEIGCSVGMLTADLAARTDRLVAVDVSPKAIAIARERLTGQGHVEFEVMQVPREWPEGLFDVVVISEVGYYLEEPELVALIDASASSLTPTGVIVACHWRHPVTDYPLSGDRVHDVIARSQRLRLLGAYVDDDFRLDVFARPGSTSVAHHEGLV